MAWGPGSLSRRGQAGLPGVCFTRTLRPFPLVPLWGPTLMTYSPQSPPPASPWGWDLSYEAGARRRGRAIPGGAPGTVSTPRTRRGIRETKPCSGGCGPAARSTCPRCSPSAGLRPGPRPPCLPSPQDVSLGRPGGPPGPVRPHRSPGPRNWLPHALPGRCESRPLSRWWGGAAAFSGVLHPGHGLVSPLCSPQKLCPLAPVLGEHGRRSGSQPPQGGKRETL